MWVAQDNACAVLCTPSASLPQALAVTIASPPELRPAQARASPPSAKHHAALRGASQREGWAGRTHGRRNGHGQGDRARAGLARKIRRLARSSAGVAHRGVIAVVAAVALRHVGTGAACRAGLALGVARALATSKAIASHARSLVAQRMTQVRSSSQRGRDSGSAPRPAGSRPPRRSRRGRRSRPQQRQW